MTDGVLTQCERNIVYFARDVEESQALRVQRDFQRSLETDMPDDLQAGLHYSTINYAARLMLPVVPSDLMTGLVEENGGGYGAAKKREVENLATGGHGRKMFIRGAPTEKDPVLIENRFGEISGVGIALRPEFDMATRNGDSARSISHERERLELLMDLVQISHFDASERDGFTLPSTFAIPLIQFSAGYLPGEGALERMLNAARRSTPNALDLTPIKAKTKKATVLLDEANA